jgi:hypothetical protein
MWAMMQKFRMRAGSVLAGVVTVPPSSHGRGGRDVLTRRAVPAAQTVVPETPDRGKGSGCS